MVRGFNPTLTSTEKSPIESKTTYFLNTSFLQHFATLNDPRIERSKEHLLIDIVAIAIFAVISGAEGWVGIETYGRAKYEWLKSFLELPNGIPSHETFSRVFARIDPQQFQNCFLSWVKTIAEKLEVEIIAVDGKTLKQSYARNPKQKALQIVSAWSSSN
jgi:DDE_Tnp_1-associated